MRAKIFTEKRPILFSQLILLGDVCTRLSVDEKDGTLSYLFITQLISYY